MPAKEANMLYFWIIAITFLLSTGAAITVSCTTQAISLLYAFFVPFGVMVYCGVLMGLADIVIRLLPRKIWNFEKAPFFVSKKEAKKYEKLGIKKWKDKAVPDLGKTAGFSKKHLDGSNEEYLLAFIKETCMGETLHAVGAVLPLTALIFCPVRDWYFVVFILIVNLFLNLLPCMIQRYNRYRLALVYTFKMRHQAERKSAIAQEDASDTSCL